MLRDKDVWLALSISAVLLIIFSHPLIWVPLVALCVVGLILQAKKRRGLGPEVGPITKRELWREVNGRWTKVEESCEEPKHH
jgi:hypothetical protein